MKILVVYYSRSGITRRAGELIADVLECDVEEVTTKSNFKGVFGWIKACCYAAKNKECDINRTTKKPKDYDIVIVGTPNLEGNVCCPIRTYLSKNKGHFKKIAFFTTTNKVVNRVFSEMEAVVGKKPRATLELTSKEVREDNYTPKIESFIKKTGIEKQEDSEVEEFLKE